MFTIDSRTGLMIEEIRNGFLGLEVIYILWKDNTHVAYSVDKINWKMGTWINKIKVDNTKSNGIVSE